MSESPGGLAQTHVDRLLPFSKFPILYVWGKEWPKDLHFPPVLGNADVALRGTTVAELLSSRALRRICTQNSLNPNYAVSGFPSWNWLRILQWASGLVTPWWSQAWASLSAGKSYPDCSRLKFPTNSLGRAVAKREEMSVVERRGHTTDQTQAEKYWKCQELEFFFYSVTPRLFIRMKVFLFILKSILMNLCSY